MWLWMLLPVEYICILIRIIAYKCKHRLHLFPELAIAAEILRKYSFLAWVFVI